jgi:hypothetical protein
MAGMPESFDEYEPRRPTWVRVVALIALLGMLAFVVAQVL